MHTTSGAAGEWTLTGILCIRWDFSCRNCWAAARWRWDGTCALSSPVIHEALLRGLTDAGADVF